MKLRYKILNGLLVVIVLAVATLAGVISYESACEPAPSVATGESARAIVYTCYGPPEVIELVDVEKPVPAGNEVLIKVHSAGVNPLDWHYMRGSPYIMRLGTGIGAPTDTRLGVDFAGTVEAVGSAVDRFEPGDEVFGGAGGAFGEYVVMPQDYAVALKPTNVSFEQAASVPIAGLTALQALRNSGRLEAGQKVLINGASGGVGTYAVQIAKAMGAEVSGVCSTRNVELVLSLGADRVFDYRNEDYTESGEQFDLIVDMVGNHSLTANRDVLKPGGTLVLVGGAKGDWIGPIAGPVKAMLVQPFVDEQIVTLLARLNKDDLATLAEMMASGAIAPVIDRRFPLEDTVEAIRYSESGRARGKIIITVE